MLPSVVITTVVAGYNQLFQEGMARLLGERFRIVKYAESLTDALTFMQSNDLNVDLVIGDPGANKAVEFEAISEIIRQFSETKLIILTSQIDHAMLEIVTQKGASGVLSDDISVAALLYSIEIVLLGERIVPMILLSSGHTPTLIQTSEATRGSKNIASLSTRETQILHCLVDGLPNKSIARNLDISEATVKVHLKMLLRKLELQNRTQAAIWALNHAVPSLDCKADC